MAKKLMMWKTKGMNRDLSVSAFNPEFSFENINLRLSTNDNNTTFSWVNEKGTGGIAISKITYYSQSPEGWSEGEYIGDNAKIFGSPVGTAVLNNILVVFTHDNSSKVDYIYKFQYVNEEKTQVEGEIIYNGGLKFSLDHPLETLVSYESEDIQKVYWTDGINLPRVINIANKDIYKCLSTAFDFIPTLQLNEEVKVKKILGGGGMFAPGVIQYAFTYYNKYGQESNIFYTTPLYYISYADRGASPEDKVDNTFKITVSKVDNNFDYLRIYSIQRTSINGTPICKRVQDIAIDGLKNYTTSYIDTGYNGDTIDPTELLYKGGSSISVGTMEQKDGTLFMGDIATPKDDIQSILTDLEKQQIINNLITSTREFYPIEVSTDNYEYSNQLTSYTDKVNQEESVPCAGFKFGNKYRCGIQFQDATGKWTDPIFLDDVEITNPSGTSVHPDAETNVAPVEPGANNLPIKVVVINNSGEDMVIRNTAYFIVGNKTKLTVKLFDSPNDTIHPNVRGINQGGQYDDAVIIDGKLYMDKAFCSVAECQSIGMPNNVVLCDIRGGINTFTMQSMAGTTIQSISSQCLLECTGQTEPAPEPAPQGKSVATTVTIVNNSGDDVNFDGKVCFVVYGTYKTYTGYLRIKGVCSGNDFSIPRGESKLYKVVFTDDSEQSPSGCVNMRFAGENERGHYQSNNAYYIGGSGYTCVDFDSTGELTFKNNGKYTMTIPEDTHEWTDTPTPPEPGNGIQFVIINHSGKEARYSGKVILNVSKSPTDWSESTQVNANIHDSYSGSYDRNDIIIPNGGTYTSPVITSITGIYQPSTDFFDGTWYFMNTDDPNNIYQHSVKLYTRIWSRTRDEYSGSDNMCWPVPPQNTKIEKGKTYYLELTSSNYNTEAYLADANTTKSSVPSNYSYAILAEGKTSLA